MTCPIPKVPHINGYRRQTSVLLAALALFLSGCGSLGAAPTPTPEPVTLQYLTLNPEGAEQELVEAYARLRPHVSFDVASYQLLPADYVTGARAPEIMFITPGWFLDSAAATGQLTDLTDLWEQTGLAERYPEGLQQLSAQNGRQLFLPVGYTWIGLYYNKELFAELGIQPPATWDQLILVADTLLDAGVRPFALAGEDDWLTSLWFDYLIMRLHGADVLHAVVRGDLPYSDARVEEALDTWRWMFENGYFDPNAARIDTLTALMATIHRPEAAFVRDKAGMILAGPDFLTDLPVTLQDDLDFVPFPVMDVNVLPGEVVIASGYMAPTNSAHPDEALRFLEFAASPQSAEAMAIIARTQDLVPAVGTATLDYVPAQLVRGSQLVRDARRVAPPAVFTMTISQQAVFARALDQMLREVDSTGTFSVIDFTTLLDAGMP